MRRRTVSFPMQCSGDCARPRPGRLALAMPLTCSIRSRRTLASSFAGLSFLGWRQLDSGPSRLGEPDGDGLLRGSCPVFALADMVHLLANELAGLRRRRLPFLPILFCTFECFF